MNVLRDFKKSCQNSSLPVKMALQYDIYNCIIFQLIVFHFKQIKSYLNILCVLSLFLCTAVTGKHL